MHLPCGKFVFSNSATLKLVRVAPSIMMDAGGHGESCLETVRRVCPWTENDDHHIPTEALIDASIMTRIWGWLL